MTQIFIEGNELDLTQELSHQLTFAIDDLSNLDSKATSFSKTIVIAGTTRNNELFGNIFEFTNSNFDNINAPNVGYNFNASRSAQAMIMINGLQAMKGVMRLLSVIVDGRNIEYEVALFGELGGFISKILNKKLEDIDFSFMNHQYNKTNIINSWGSSASYLITTSSTFTASTKTIVINRSLSRLLVGDQIKISGTTNNNGIFTITSIRNIPILNRTTIVVAESLVNETDSSFTIDLITGGYGRGYIYPLIDYGNVTYNYPPNNPTYLKNKDYTFRAFRPAIFVYEYMYQIITNAGYTFESSFFNTNFFRRLIIPNNGAGLEKIGISNYVKADGKLQIQQNNITSSFTTKIPWSNWTLNTFTIASPNTDLVFSGVSSRTIKVTAIFDGTYSSASRFQTALGLLLAKSTGEIIANYNFENTDGATRNFNIQLEGITTINTGEFIYVAYIGRAANFNGLYDLDYSLDFSMQINIIQDPPSFVLYDYNDPILMNDTIPRNIYQKDFFTSILKMFNLMVTEDKFKERHLKIEPYIDFFNSDRRTFLDWSNKVNRDKPIVIKPMAEANARIYQFKYKSDTDFYNEEYKKKYNETYGDRVFDNQLEFAKDNQTLEIIFSPSVLVGYPDRDKIVSTIYKKNNDIEESIAHNIRIMQIKLKKNVDPWAILVNNAPVETGLTSYLYAGHFNDPDFPTSDINFGATREVKYSLSGGALGNNLFNAFYSPYMAEIIDKDSRIVTCEMYLTETDIFKLDFSKFVFIDGALYRVEKIIDWSENNLCKVELLRVINTSYVKTINYADEVIIGNQIWAKQNLATFKYNNGDEIPFVDFTLQDADLLWQYYGSNGIGCCAAFKGNSKEDAINDPSILEWGLLYNAYAVLDPRGIAPTGYRVPTQADFNALDSFTGADGDPLKEEGFIHWNSPNSNTNTLDFTAFGSSLMPADGDLDGHSFLLFKEAYFWSSTPKDNGNTYFMNLNKNDGQILIGYDLNSIGFSVRLIKE